MTINGEEIFNHGTAVIYQNEILTNHREGVVYQGDTLFYAEVNEKTGEIVNSDALDISNSYNNNTLDSRLQGFMDYAQTIPEGRIFVAAFSSTSVNSYSPNRAALVRALEAFGSQSFRNVTSGDSWVMVGVKGAKQGSIYEVWNPTKQSLDGEKSNKNAHEFFHFSSNFNLDTVFDPY